MYAHRRGAIVAMLAALAACAAPEKPVAGQPIPKGPLVRGVSYVGISVSDIEKSAAFYTNALGLTEVDRNALAGVSALDQLNGGAAVKAQTRLLRGDRGQIRLMKFATQSAEAMQTSIMPVQGPGITHVCHQSTDAKPIFPRLVAAGAKPLSRTGELVQLSPAVPIRYAYLRDRDGVMMENEQYIGENLPWSYHMGHVAIATSDIERTVNFYSKLLGKPPRERRFNLANKTLDLVSELDGVKLNVAWYEINNLELEVWQYLNPPPTPRAKPRPLTALGYNVIVLDVADTDAAGRLLVEAGGTIASKPASMDGARIVFGRDPDGNLIGLQTPTVGSAFSVATLPTK